MINKSSAKGRIRPQAVAQLSFLNVCFEYFYTLFGLTTTLGIVNLTGFWQTGRHENSNTQLPPSSFSL